MARDLHSLAVDGCPFDRRLATAIPEALAADIGFAHLDGERAGWTRDELVARLTATRPAEEDLVVCHGDLCLPNVLLDPETCRVTGLIDAGRLGVADRWADLAIVTRSLVGRLDSPAAERFVGAYGIVGDPEKIAFYRLLDEFF